MKIRAAKKLIDEGLSTRRVRAHIEFLDQEFPDWAHRDPREFGGAAIVRVTDEAYVKATPGMQLVIPALALQVLDVLSKEGALGELREFEPHITMNPRIFCGNPVIRGTRIETSFVAQLIARGVDQRTVEETYDLGPSVVARVLEFERLAA